MLNNKDSEYRRTTKKFGYTDERVEVLRQNMQRFIEVEDAW